jgi:carboxylesterase
MSGCEPWSHAAGARVGALVLHGFTGTPASVRDIAEALGKAGYDVELPRLPGHGTTVEDMMTTTWADWVGEVETAYQRLADRVERVVVIGLSMGGTLALRIALDHQSVAGLGLVNPATQQRDVATLETIAKMLDDGVTVVPGEGSDIADPDSSDIAYAGTPLEPLQGLLRDGIAPICDRYGELTAPLRLFTSRNDHVVDPNDSVHLAATYAGPVEHTWLERSFHVATRDFDRDLVVDELLSFVGRLASARSTS